MPDLIVTDHSIERPGRILTWDEFLEAASSDEGLDLSGELYLDVSGLDKDIYEAIAESIPSVKFFTLGDSKVPGFLDSREVLDWSQDAEYIGHDLEDPDQPMEIDPSEFDSNILTEFDGIESVELNEEAYSGKQARIILFGSSKGGTGKTFTCLISAYRYAKTHPNERVAVSDFDIIDGQVGITIHKITPTMLDYYKMYRFGKTDFETMERFKAKSVHFPENLDFYLAPRDMYINDDDFWDSIFINLIENYDVIFFDSGIDYMHYKPISTLYKIADKIILISTTSIKSVSSVSKQIKRLKGEIENPVFSKEDEIGPKLNLVITQAGKADEMNARVIQIFKPKINILGVFGIIASDIQKAEYFGRWDIFDKNTKFNETLDRIVE